MITYNEMVRQITLAFSTSYWLKAQLLELQNRDPLDALKDADILAQVCKVRVDELMKRDEVKHGKVHS